MKRREFLKLLAIGSASLAMPCCVWGQSKRAGKKPNILFIAIDDLRPELGCYGNKHVKSPAIDRLGRSGVVFNRAYCQQAVCNPSRASLLTGLRPDSLKVWDLRVHFREVAPDVVTLPQHFKNNGYYTAAIGKIFHTAGEPMEDPISWTIPKMKPRDRTRVWPDDILAEHKKFRDQCRARGKTKAQINRIRPTATVCRDVPDNTRYDGAQTDMAIEKLWELKEHSKPFFLAVGYIRPHLPFAAPKKYWDMYDRADIPLAKNDFLPQGSPPMAMNTMYELRDYMDFLDTPAPDEGALTQEQQRLLKHGYYACVSFVDAQIARLIAALDKAGLRDNTIIVLWGDHGWKLGEHRSWCKQTNYEIDTHVPLIICDPRAGANGTSSNALVEFVDIYPTLCELAGLAVPDHTEGRSLAPLLDEPDSEWKSEAFSQFQRRHKGDRYMGYSIRTDRYRFVEWRNWETGQVAATELYDRADDPQENVNVADKPANKRRVALLSERLRRTCPVISPGSLVSGPRSVKSNTPARLRIINRLDEPVAVYWIDTYGGRTYKGRIEPDGDRTQNTFMGHVFLVVSQSGQYRTLLKASDYAARPAILRPEKK